MELARESNSQLAPANQTIEDESNRLVSYQNRIEESPKQNDA
jgi:hypothetical protein